MLNTLYLIGGILVGVVALGAIGAWGRNGWRFSRRMGSFLDDWAGTEARPGVKRRPGVMERLDLIEHEVTNNNGTSIKDSMGRVESTLVDMDGRLDRLEGGARP